MKINVPQRMIAQRIFTSMENKCKYCKDTGIAGIMINGQLERDVCDRCDAFDLIQAEIELEVIDKSKEELIGNGE